MLGHTFRYFFRNDTGVAMSVVLRRRGIKFASDGSRTDGANVVHINGLTVGANDIAISGAVDNSTDKFIAEDLLFTATPATSVATPGTVSMFLQRSTDGGASWPTNSQGGQWLSSLNFTSGTLPQTASAAVR